VKRRIFGEWRPGHPLGIRARVQGGRQRKAIIGLASVAGVVSLGLMACDWNATLDATDRANDRLDRTESELHQTQDDLGATLDTVDANRLTLAGAIKTRLAREAERRQSQGTYDANVLWLQGLQGALDNANATLQTSTGQLDALQACVAGATEALNQAAAGDTGGLATTVRGIEDVCAQAGVQL
jgi:hypothetical protein